MIGTARTIRERLARRCPLALSNELMRCLYAGVALSAFGLPWFAPGLVAQIPPQAVLLNPSLAVTPPILVPDGDHVHGVAIDGQGRLRHFRSADGGRTWPIVEQALPSGFVASGFRSVLAGSGVLLIVYRDAVLGPLLLRTADHGVTWSGPTVLAPAYVPSAILEYEDCAVGVDGATVCVTWNERTAQGGVHCLRSIDGGATWGPVVHLGPAIAEGCSELQCLVNGSTVHAWWVAPSAPALQYLQTSGTAGATWGPVMPMPFAANRVREGGGVLLATTNQDSVCMRSTDSGVTWTTLSIPGMNPIVDLSLQGSVAFAVGYTGSFFNRTYALNVSLDGGLTWQSSPMQLPSPVPLAVSVQQDRKSVV